MKGQFMLISSILIGFIVISAATTISEVQRENFQSKDTANTINMLKEEAQKVDDTDQREVENYIKMVSMISEYETSVQHWRANSCFNVTLTSTGQQINLDCIG